MFAPYLMGTLVVEFNNVFLHARRLYLFAGGVKSTSSDFYMWNLFLLIGVFQEGPANSTESHTLPAIGFRDSIWF
jgi:hypothetical protein